ncbi:MAG: FAD-dependent oxidoreductase [Acidobacteriaceae bacterium]
MNHLRRAIVCVFVFSTLISARQLQAAAHPESSYDVVVYGATASGAMAAIAAAREGMHVVLLEPGNHVGGMLTGGLSATDVGNRNVIGGDALEFFERVGQYYDMKQYDQTVSWRFEPHVGEGILRSMLQDAKVDVRFHERMREQDGERKSEARIISLTTEDGAVWKGKVFVDATYEGDLMAAAGVSFAWGREGIAQYGESLAGVRAETPGHQFKFKLSAYGTDGKLLPEISPVPMAPPGSGDHEVQAYNFRLILTQDPANLVPFPKPGNYDPHEYQLLANYIRGFQQQYGRAPRLNELTNPVGIPNYKADFNNNGPFSTDYIGRDWTFPNASYAQRQAIWQDHIDYTKGFFYFLAHDPQVPQQLRNEVNTWGLAKDEFTDTDNWPFQLYIRESRRMIGEYVMTQKDVQTERSKVDAIGMGSYNIDSHNFERVAMPDGGVQNEGNTEIHVQPYQIPYRILVPQAKQVSNLLVPVCVSSSHVAYSSLRLEPQYMIMGQAAGIAASLAERTDTPVQAIDIKTLQEKLLRQGATLELASPALRTTTAP